MWNVLSASTLNNAMVTVALTPQNLLLTPQKLLLTPQNLLLTPSEYTVNPLRIYC